MKNKHNGSDISSLDTTFGKDLDQSGLIKSYLGDSKWFVHILVPRAHFGVKRDAIQ